MIETVMIALFWVLFGLALGGGLIGCLIQSEEALFAGVLFSLLAIAIAIKQIG